MAKKKAGIYTNLEGGSNNKVEDLYVIINHDNFIFTVKHKISNTFIAFEHFSNNESSIGWHKLLGYIQNNSKLINHVYANIYFVWNSSKFILTKKFAKPDSILYQQELNLVHGTSFEEELYITPFNENLVLLFTVPDTLNSLLSRLFPNGKWHHYAEYILANKVENEVQLHLFEHIFCLSVVKDGITQLINYYPIEGNDQNCYTILNTCSNINIETNISNLTVRGYSSQVHEFVNQVAKYFKNASIIEPPINGIGATLNTNYPNNLYATYFIF